MYDIENAVKLPEPHLTKNKYPFSKMQVGDSFFVQSDTFQCLPYKAAKNYCSRTGKKFSGRLVDGGLRIWRTV
jgi:hypothetical protein